MRFKAKPYIKVGTKDWETFIPRPPKNATHARMTCIDPHSLSSTPKTATLPLQDFGCFRGVCGEFKYIRMDNKRKVVKVYSETYHWNGRTVDGIEELMEQ
tara:strand:+ start:12958 stop:13257 length:300 start_codon:yes stop_codon:yes gene_type:complete